MIVVTALNLSKDGESVTVLANDTDIVIMLMHFWENQLGTIVVRSEYKMSGGKQLKQLNVQSAVSTVNVTIVPYLLVIHEFGDVIRRLQSHDKGKAAILRLVQRSNRARQLCGIFLANSSSTDEIGEAGIELFILMFNGKIGDTLTELIYNNYMKMAAYSSKIVPSKLPPTERAALYHSLRVYLQIQQWKTPECAMYPLDWDWKVENGRMTPITTDKEIAPEELLLVIRCNCKLSSRNPCGSNQCSCQRNGIQCVPACGDCRGMGCNNSSREMEDDK